MEGSMQDWQSFVDTTQRELAQFLRPLTQIFPDQRLRRNGVQLIRGLIVGQVPHLTKAMWKGSEKGSSA
jgi:hypothetical protein